jgi:hypothetical protein
MYYSQAVYEKLLTKKSGFYRPEVLAEQLLDCLQLMEEKSNKPMLGFRSRTGLLNVASFRERPIKNTENAITEWMSELIPNSSTQVRNLISGVIPDIVFAFDRDAFEENVIVILEAKPVWHTWISSQKKVNKVETVDERGVTFHASWRRNILQLRRDRDKLLSVYQTPSHRLMLLALVFQRQGELDQMVIDSIGSHWTFRSRHIADQCDSSGEHIGLTGMLFWPITSESSHV